MKTDVRISVRQITGLDTLIGKTGGTRDFPKFMEAVSTKPDGSTVIFDWSAIEIATASYFGSTVLPLLRMSTTGGMDRYFLHVGLNQNCLDELRLVAEYQNLVVLVGDVRSGDSIRNISVLGKLEPVYSETLAAIKASRTASAGTLYREQPTKCAKIGKTGWANRLSHLFRLRLVKRHRVGRELVFQPVYGGD
jgi:hypothetical protein